jgi:Bacterial EndoU nuclease
MKTQFKILALLFVFSPVAQAAGVNCAMLAEWSASIDGYAVNQHHVFCGESGKNGAAKGFHSMPGGEAPSTYISSRNADDPNGAGIYTLRNIKLNIDGTDYTKSFSSMFPKACSMDQINRSIVYSLVNSSGACSAPDWAQCGPNAPINSKDATYCLGSNGNQFTIATAKPTGGTPKKINTGFPILTK